MDLVGNGIKGTRSLAQRSIKPFNWDNRLPQNLGIVTI